MPNFNLNTLIAETKQRRGQPAPEPVTVDFHARTGEVLTLTLPPYLPMAVDLLYNEQQALNAQIREMVEAGDDPGADTAIVAMLAVEENLRKVLFGDEQYQTLIRSGIDSTDLQAAVMGVLADVYHYLEFVPIPAPEAAEGDPGNAETGETPPPPPASGTSRSGRKSKATSSGNTGST